MAGEELKESKSSDKNKLQKSYFDVLGLCCSSEVPLIENILKSLDGVKEVSVIVPSRTVIVVHDNLIVSQLQIGNYHQSSKNFFYLFLLIGSYKKPAGTSNSDNLLLPKVLIFDLILLAR